MTTGKWTTHVCFFCFFFFIFFSYIYHILLLDIFSKWKFFRNSDFSKLGGQMNIAGSPRPSHNIWHWMRAKEIKTRLTHLPLDKMAAISQAIFSDAFSWMKIFIFWSKFHWNLFLRVQLTITQHFVPSLVPSHYLNQCWPDSLTHICGTWVNFVVSTVSADVLVPMKAACKSM